jgi:hypothetical protein
MTLSLKTYLSTVESFVGYTGSQGTNGDQGYTGSQGPSGGYAGSQGEVGFVGSRGDLSVEDAVAFSIALGG